jgi:hypothetical protein
MACPDDRTGHPDSRRSESQATTELSSHPQFPFGGASILNSGKSAENPVSRGNYRRIRSKNQLVRPKTCKTEQGIQIALTAKFNPVSGIYKPENWDFKKRRRLRICFPTFPGEQTDRKPRITQPRYPGRGHNLGVGVSETQSTNPILQRAELIRCDNFD